MPLNGLPALYINIRNDVFLSVRGEMYINTFRLISLNKGGTSQTGMYLKASVARVGLFALKNQRWYSIPLSRTPRASRSAPVVITVLREGISIPDGGVSPFMGGLSPECQ